MALPIIAAGIAARYGAKKLAKALVKRNTKNYKAPKITFKKKIPTQKSLFKKGELEAPSNLFSTKHYLSPARDSIADLSNKSGLLRVSPLVRKLLEKNIKK
jgi:hypothetical protein